MVISYDQSSRYCWRTATAGKTIKNVIGKQINSMLYGYYVTAKNTRGKAAFLVDSIPRCSPPYLQDAGFRWVPRQSKLFQERRARGVCISIGKVRRPLGYK